MDRQRLKEVARQLLEYGEQVDPKDLIPAIEPEASSFVYEDPFAFVLGAFLD